MAKAKTKQDSGEQDKSAEQKDREQQVKDLRDETEVVSVNLDNTEHQRWLETGETEPEFMIPQPDDEDDDEDDDDDK
jgi:hypothetical protein